jgi:hypothetical protein
MSKSLIGVLFIVAGVLYGCLAIDGVYGKTLGWLVENQWVKPPAAGKTDFTKILGRKPTILLYSLVLIIIGAFILWNRSN